MDISSFVKLILSVFLQTYLVKRNGDYMPSKVTYIDYVHLDSPAFDAGIRAGSFLF